MQRFDLRGEVRERRQAAKGFVLSRHAETVLGKEVRERDAADALGHPAEELPPGFREDGAPYWMHGHLFNTSSRFKSSLASIVHAADSTAGSASSAGESPTARSVRASSGFSRYKPRNPS